MIDRWPVNEAAVVRLLDHGHAVFAQIHGNLLLRDDRRRRRRPQVLEPAVRAQVHAALRQAPSGFDAHPVQRVQPARKQRALPGVEPIRAQVDVLGRQALEVGGG